VTDSADATGATAPVDAGRTARAPKPLVREATGPVSSGGPTREERPA